ncbi:MAG: hypothetical protein ACK4FE_05960 [Azonexus sp.]
MRLWWVLACAALFSGHVHAADSSADESVSFVDAASTPADVTITPVPMPAQVTELLAPVNPAAKLRAAKKAKLARKKVFPQILLSRTERHQVALFAAALKSNGQLTFNVFNDEDGPAGYDELALHQFYSRPRLVEDEDDERDDGQGLADLSDTARIRLLMARLKALEAHALAHIADDGEALPETITQRLAAARQRAVAAHQARFS